MDVREEGAVQESVEAAVKHFGGIDIVVRLSRNGSNSLFYWFFVGRSTMPVPST